MGLQERRGSSPAATHLPISELYCNLNFVSLQTAANNLFHVLQQYLVTETEIVPIASDIYHTLV
jgi:hypothetical protein